MLAAFGPPDTDHASGLAVVKPEQEGKPETTQGRTRATVLRMPPCLFELYSVVVLCYGQLSARWRRGGGD